MNLLEIVNAGILRQLSNRLVAVKTEVTNQGNGANLLI